MATSVRSLGAALAAIVGRDAVSDDAARTSAAALDGVVPRAVVRPSSTEQVAHVLVLAHEERLVVAPRARGTSLDAGTPPVRVDLVLDMTGLDRVLEWSPDDLTASVEAGITLGTLNETVLGPRRQALPLDPVGWRRRSVGGVTATNASGPWRARYGTMRDLLLGVRFVQADGVVTWGGAKVVKSVTGYDVPKLMVGALGTLGVLTELTLRLHPLPETERTWFVTGPSLEMIQACLDALIDSALQPTRVDVLDTLALAGFGAGDAKAALAVSFGSVADAVHEQGERLVAIGRGAGASVTERPMELWHDLERVTTPAAGDVTLDIATLPARIAETLRAFGREEATLGRGARSIVTGRGTVGALTAVVKGAAPAAVASLVTRLRAIVADHDGSVVVRGGPREARAAIDPWGPLDPHVMDLTRTIKQTFDPRGVLNAGRFVGGL
ncbi:MAG: FAD-binding oxidoreductase [Candidatus Rokubacteria bacterium]|nr:FAD-binding oxidoreductase [Candidatus Rokubacteria bacterium]